MESFLGGDVDKSLEMFSGDLESSLTSLEKRITAELWGAGLLSSTYVAEGLSLGGGTFWFPNVATFLATIDCGLTGIG